MGIPALVGFCIGFLPWRYALAILAGVIVLEGGGIVLLGRLFSPEDPNAGLLPILMLIPFAMTLFFAGAMGAGMLARDFFEQVEH